MSRQDPGWLRRWWPAFLVATALAFAVPETVAIVDGGRGGTLTEVLQGWLGVGDGTLSVGWVALTVGLVLFVVWFPLHLLNFWPWERAQSRKPDKID